MIHPFTIVTIILANGYLIIGLEMINNNPSRRLAYAGGINSIVISSFFFISAVTKNSVNGDVFLFWNKVAWALACIAIGMLPYSSYALLEASRMPIRWMHNAIRINFLVAVFLAVLLIFTNIFIQDQAISAEAGYYTNWYPVTTHYSFIFLFYGVLSTIIAMYNSWKIDFTNVNGNTSARVFMLTVGGMAMTLVGVTLAAIGAVYSHSTQIPFEAMGEFSVLIGSFLGYFALRNADLYIGDHIFVHRQIKNMILTGGFWVLFYTFVLVFISPMVGGAHSTILIGGLVAFTVTTTSIFDGYVRRFFAWLNKNNDVYLSLTDTAYLLRYFNRAIRIEQTDLANSTVVKRMAKNTRRSEVDVVRDLIREAVKTMEPKGSLNKRTQKTIKYEILRMTVFETAKESNILWDLGFDCTSKNTSLNTKPRLAVTSNSEYSSTSIPSFRRIKHEAIEELTWRLLKLLK